MSKSAAGGDHGPLAGATGDGRCRVTIGLPKSLADLQKAAKVNFGHKGVGQMKLIHNGQSHLKLPSHFDNVQHEDVIVVSIRPLESAKVPLSTKQEHFVRHRIEPRALREELKVPPGPSAVPFVANSTQRESYVRHSFEKKKESQPMLRKSWSRPSEEFTGKSTYAAHFIEKNMIGRGVPANREAPKDNLPPGKVYMETTQRADYVQHKWSPQSPSSSDRSPPKYGERKFDGSTTYNSDFLKHKHDKHKRPASSGASAYVSDKHVPFHGASSYASAFGWHQIPQRPQIHLEPEAADASRIR